MASTHFAGDAEFVLEIIGTVAFAVSGAMLAIRKDFDIVGIVLLGSITALGGGIVRDVLIGSLPPAAFANLDFLLVAGFTAVVAAITHATIARVERSIQLFDAIGLALFTVNGTLIARESGLAPVPAALLGVATGVGGGLARDVIARDVPLLVRRDSEIYAIPSGIGAFVVAYADDLGVYSAVVGVLAALLVFGLRAAAMTFGWHAPGAWRRR